MAKGAAWMVVFKLTERGLGLISTMILARLLVPADFGLIAMAMSVIAMLELLGSFSLDVTLIQHPRAERVHYDTAWTFGMLVSVGIAAVLLVVAPLGARFYHEPRLEVLIWCLALGTFIQGFENVGVVAFRKELQFHREFWYLLGKKLVSFTITVPLAFTLRNHWALVGGMLGGRLGSVALSYLVQSYRPRLSLAAHRELFHLSKWLVINNICFFFNGRAGDFIIGKLAGPNVLGLYNVSYEIANLPTSELVAPMNRAIFPGYAKKASDGASLRSGFLDVVSMIALFAMPAGAGIAATANLLIPVFLSDAWVDAGPLIAVLGFYGIFMAIQGNNGYVYLALGRPRIITLVAGVQVALLAVLVSTLTLKAGAIGAAWGYFATGLLAAPLNYAILFRLLELRPRDLVARIWRPSVATTVMFVGVRLLAASLGPSRSAFEEWAQLFSAVGAGAVIYALVLLGLWLLCARPSGAEQIALEFLSAKLRFKSA